MFKKVILLTLDRNFQKIMKVSNLRASRAKIFSILEFLLYLSATCFCASKFYTIFPDFYRCTTHVLSKNRVFQIKSWMLVVGNKKLRFVRVRTVICHRHNATCVVLKIKGLLTKYKEVATYF